MGKKTKPKPQRTSTSAYNDPASNMLTQQQQKMMYSNKRHTQEDPSQHGGVKSQSNQPNDLEDQYDDHLAHLQLSNLTHTSAEQITQFINKLIAKNKITSKNAFDIPLIHLQQMEDFRASLNDNTWKRLSSTLENDYKIYGYRVDATHTITYKMVESIARHEATAEEIGYRKSEVLVAKNHVKKGSSQNDLLLESFVDNEFSENVNKNKLNVDYAKFIEKNQKLLNIGQIESFFGYNPGLQRTKRKFDQQGFRSLLLNNIQLRNGCELKLDEHYYKEDQEQPKKEMIQENAIEGKDKMSQEQFEQMMDRIGEKSEDMIVPEGEENLKSIFTEIYELNVNQAKARDDDFAQFQKLYRIVSKEDKAERRAKKKLQPIVEELKQNETRNVENIENISNPEQIFNEQEQNLIKNELQEPILEENNQDDIHNQIVQNLNQNENPLQVSKDQQKNENPRPNTTKNLPIENIQSQPHHSSQAPKEQSQHILANKNFQMKQLNLQNLDLESQSSHSNHQKIQYTGKLKNIEEYIKIKERSRKDKKAKINIDELDPEQIRKVLFNKKYTKKKPQKTTKIQDLLKDESGLNLKKKIDFDLLKKQTNDLKRSTIFKKSLTEERIFTQTKQKIKEKLQQRDKQKNASKQAEIEKKKKGKKVSKLFDLPIYQFEQSDANFINPIEEIDPQTSELEFSDLYKYHFPSFVFSSNQILEEIKRKKDLMEKELLEKQREVEQKKKLQERNMLGMIEEENTLHNEATENIIEEQKAFENSDNISPDISFINDEMGQVKGNQVVIRQAKEKVRKLMLKMFKEIKAKNNNPQQKYKPRKLTYKNIYEAYYRQNGYISPALCFLTILHLANEHNLSLEGKQDGSNFKIWVEQENEIAHGFDGQEELNSSKIEIEQSFFYREESSVSSVKSRNQNILRDLSRSEYD